MKDKPLSDLLNDMRVLRGEIAALEELRKAKQAELSSHNDEVLRRMNSALSEEFGSEFAPRITFYTDDKKTGALAARLVATVTFAEAE